MLAYTCNIHKVQGLAITITVVVLDLKKQKSFNYGQLYVALSRAKSLLGLFRKQFVSCICFIMSPTVYTLYNIESKLFSVYYTFVGTFYCF